MATLCMLTAHSYINTLMVRPYLPFLVMICQGILCVMPIINMRYMLGVMRTVHRLNRCRILLCPMDNHPMVELH